MTVHHTANIELETATQPNGQFCIREAVSATVWAITPTSKEICRLRAALLAQALNFREALQRIAQTDAHLPHTMKGIAKMALAAAKDATQTAKANAREYYGS